MASWIKLIALRPIKIFILVLFEEVVLVFIFRTLLR